jgi:SP family sugar:H+ symporter-like MFS transporter
MRGRLTSPQQMGIVVGILIAFLVDYWITLAAGSVTAPYWFGREAWRCMFLTEAVPALALVGASLVIPELPRFLVGQKRDDDPIGLADSRGPSHASKR